MDAYECVDGWLGILADVCTVVVPKSSCRISPKLFNPKL